MDKPSLAKDDDSAENDGGRGKAGGCEEEGEDAEAEGDAPPGEAVERRERRADRYWTTCAGTSGRG